ncbi:MAG TPA: HEPN domain-containing protein [bacterium]|nr:HEPN domain-containing protein [bacterium]
MERKLGPEFESCLKSGRIRRFSPGPTLVAGELAAAGQDLDEARRTLVAGGLKWATIQAYYSMFHSARALLYARGYRERSHRCLVIALRELYVGSRLLELEFVEGLEAGKTLRENADYYSRFSEAGSRQAVELAASFLARARTLTSKPVGPT